MDFQLIEIDPSTVEFNPWNPNVMSPELFIKEVRSIKENGFIDPITVRELGEGLQVIDGAHRVRAARELQLATIPAVNLGVVDDAKAKRLTIIANELRGSPRSDLLSTLLADLATSDTTAALAEVLPFTQLELDSLVSSVTTYDWDALPPAEADVVREVDIAAKGEVAFRLGTIKGPVPAQLSRTLLELWKRTSARVQSSTPEAVLKEWATLLLAALPAEPEPTQVVKPARKLSKKKAV